MAVINLNAVFVNISNGEKIETSKDKFMSLGEVLINAALADSEEKLSGDEKVKKYKLAKKISEAQESGSVSLQAEDVALLKKEVARIYPPIIVGQSYDFLEGEVS